MQANEAANMEPANHNQPYFSPPKKPQAQKRNQSGYFLQNCITEANAQQVIRSKQWKLAETYNSLNGTPFSTSFTPLGNQFHPTKYREMRATTTIEYQDQGTNDSSSLYPLMNNQKMQQKNQDLAHLARGADPAAATPTNMPKKKIQFNVQKLPGIEGVR